MRQSARNIGLLFLAVSSVYLGNTVAADSGDPASRTSWSGMRPPLAQATRRPSPLYFAPESVPPTKVVQTIPVDQDATTPTDPQPKPETPATDPFGQTTVVDQADTGNNLTTDDVNVDTDAGTVEIHVNDANLVEVLRMLSLQSQRNIIASKEVKGTVTANLYGVTVREALDAILLANGYAYREEGNFVYVYTAQELKDQQQANRVRKTQVYRCYYTPVATAVNMIKPILSKEGEVAFTDPAKSGLESGASDVGGNSHSTEDVMVVTDYEDRLEEITRVLAEIDKRPQQILIEATILRATLNEDNALGVDFQVLGGVDFGGLTGAGTSFGAAVGGGITNTAGAAGVVDSGYGGAGTGFTNNVPNGGLQVGLVKNNIAVFIEALESVTDTAVLANPKVLALNKQKGEVIVGRKDGYITSTTTDTATVQTVEFLDTGTRLVFRPYIGDDGYIRMEIHPEDSSGGLTAGNLPFKVTTEVTSNVMVKDGNTIVIGGLFREDSNSTRAQVPLLGNIPVAGALFRSQRDRTTREEIIILLTPHIVKDDNVFSEMSKQELKRMDQLRVGVRRGMMMWGRERLAEGFYDSAVAEMSKPNGDQNKALWNLNAATNLNPKFIEAIELKQQITAKELTTVDNSLSRDFVRDMITKDLARMDAVPHVNPTPTKSPVPTKKDEEAEPVTAAAVLKTEADFFDDEPEEATQASVELE
jgi:type IV pilus assembly protein PilQ